METSSALAEHFLRLAEDYQRIAEQLDRFWVRIFNSTNLKTKIHILLFFHPQEWTITQLSHELKASSGNVAYCLKQLCREGYVTQVSRKKYKIKL